MVSFIVRIRGPTMHLVARVWHWEILPHNQLTINKGEGILVCQFLERVAFNDTTRFLGEVDEFENYTIKDWSQCSMSFLLSTCLAENSKNRVSRRIWISKVQNLWFQVQVKCIALVLEMLESRPLLSLRYLDPHRGERETEKGFGVSGRTILSLAPLALFVVEVGGGHLPTYPL